MNSVLRLSIEEINLPDTEPKEQRGIHSELVGSVIDAGGRGYPLGGRG